VLLYICILYTALNYWTTSSQPSLIIKIIFYAVFSSIDVALILWVNFFSLQIVYVWLKNQTTKNITSTALFLRSLAAKQHAYLDTVGKGLSLWQETFWSVRDILQEKNKIYKEMHILCSVFSTVPASLATQTVPELCNFKLHNFKLTQF
jgi:hypothetical protein